MHVAIDELVDIAEGTRPEASAPHLAGCEPCRAQLADLRAMIAAASAVEVPELSPLFWDHLSARVSDAVAQEREAGRRWFGIRASDGGLRAPWWKRGVLEPRLAVAAAGLLLAVVLGSRALAPAPPQASAPSFAVAAPPPDNLADPSADDDASLTLMASLTGGVDLDTAREAGLAPGGSAEHAVTHMTDGELRELRRLLNEELTRSGA